MITLTVLFYGAFWEPIRRNSRHLAFLLCHAVYFLKLI
ncbi:unknown protein [Cronobacter turicensis z3032]|uniref:Uncharacterized protein n=1 Tax=Cronobacter turicensis (strain DSM 18703 / CCUG 55852 / LMG 23827 / z3032) TaxID=693216 RepID=C9Y4J8_CROTZ|nr:unknown protein [Cronobacter turicensis z3032]